MVTLLPEVSTFVSTIAPWAPVVMPAVVVRIAFAEFVLATLSVCVPDAAPTVSAFRLTVAPFSSTVYVPAVVMQTSSVDVGTAFVLQLAAVNQLPPEVFVHVFVQPLASAADGSRTAATASTARARAIRPDF